MPVAEAAPRAWQRMLSGRRLNLLDPSPLDIEIGDIAHGLARVSRWNGQTSGDYALSVAQHCLMVEAVVADQGAVPGLCLAALLHDGPEYVIGDMISPFKAQIGQDYKRIEQALEQAIHVRFGLPARLPEAWHAKIKEADRICAFAEAVDLAGFAEEEARRIFGVRRKRRLPPAPILPWPPNQAARRYLTRFAALERLCAA